MPDSFHIKKPFIEQSAALTCSVTDQAQGFIPSDPNKSLRTSYHECLLHEPIRHTDRAINPTPDCKAWLTDRQLDDPFTLQSTAAKRFGSIPCPEA